MTTPADKFKRHLSGFLGGPNIDAMVGTLADQQQKLTELSIAVTDQLTISTASSVYLDKKLADKGITRPPELGMSDLSYRRLGIQITATKQLSELIHNVLETFYGFQAVRANLTSIQAEPYPLQDGMDLTIVLEDGIQRTLTFNTSDFRNINQATASEVSSVITRFIRTQGLNGFAQTVTDLDTGEVRVQAYGGAKGPYSSISVLGGEAQLYLQFPAIRNTELLINDTAWQVTRTTGSTLRFRWIGNTQPNLVQVLPGDQVLLYGAAFKDAGLSGTYEVTNVRPPQSSVTLTSGWFEISKLEFSKLRSVQPDTAPPGNAPPIFYSIDIPTATAKDVFFFRPVKAVANNQIRYALAWEPRRDLLKIYMPATTDVVQRGLEGASHLHMLFEPTNLNGSFGSTTADESKLEIISDRIIRYKQLGYDNVATGGTIIYGATTRAISTCHRENFFTTITTVLPHGITGSADSFGRILSTTIINVTIGVTAKDDIALPFPGPYIVDPEANYAIRSENCTSREKIFAGQTINTLSVSGSLPNAPGFLLMDLGQDNQESPIPYIGVQSVNSVSPVDLASISQNGFVVTVSTASPHGAIVGSLVSISGTASFDGTYTVTSVPTSQTYVYTSLVSQVTAQFGVGTSVLVVNDIQSIVLLNQSYVFKKNHVSGADLTLMSEKIAYEPALNGTDYPFFVTGVANGRVFAQEIIEQVTALGIKLEIIVVYPSDVGLGNEGGSDDPNDPPASDKIYVWGI